MPTSTRFPRRVRAGMSLVEVIVALILVTIGLLGMAGSTALALRTAHDASQRRTATHRIVSRHSQLAAAGCTAARSGTSADPSRDLTENWYVSVQPNGFALVTDSVRWMSARGPRSFVLTSAFQC
ncbi:MAG: prepilin-type N-terminal cleavage/methylation domain-containing protein [bacterium]